MKTKQCYETHTACHGDTCNETKHTPEPWEAMEYVIYGPAGSATPMIAEINQYGRDFDTPHANARRIVACVNACAGIDTGRVENIAAVGGFDAVVLRGSELLEQRDELAEALRGLYDLRSSIINEARTHGFSTQRIEAALTVARDTLAKL